MAALAMALILEEQMRQNSDRLFGDYAYRNWKNKSKSLAEAYIQTGLTPFQNYKEVDKEEFFVVSVVYFFEDPQSFHSKFPSLYAAMKKLFKQNPLEYKLHSN